MIAAGAIMTVLFATSAIYGFGATGACRALNGGVGNPYQTTPEIQRDRAARHADEAAEETAVQARLKAKAAADAKGAAPPDEATATAPAVPPSHPPHRPRPEPAQSA